VCYNVAGLQFDFQTDTFQDILSYQAGGAVGVGPLLSALCAFMWFTRVRPPPHSEHSRRLRFTRACVRAPSRELHAQVMDEMGHTLTTTHAVARLHGKTTSFIDGVVVSVGTPRLLCFLAMQAFQLAVASLLCYGGAYFIGHTIVLGDLILNCIALEVRSIFPPASLLLWAFSWLVGCVSSVLSLCTCFVWPCAPPVPRTRVHREVRIRAAWCAANVWCKLCASRLGCGHSMPCVAVAIVHT
jgi:hypothetical protein